MLHGLKLFVIAVINNVKRRSSENYSFFKWSHLFGATKQFNTPYNDSKTLADFVTHVGRAFSLRIELTFGLYRPLGAAKLRLAYLTILYFKRVGNEVIIQGDSGKFERARTCGKKLM